MANKKTRVHFVIFILGSFLALHGCAAVGLTLFGVGAGVTTGTSVANGKGHSK